MRVKKIFIRRTEDDAMCTDFMTDDAKLSQELADKYNSKFLDVIRELIAEVED